VPRLSASLPARLVGALLVAAAAPTAARAQFGGVIPPPPPPPLPVAVGDSAAGRLVTPRDTADLRQRLDIQAWVDSAAGALARTPAGARRVLPPDSPPPQGAAVGEPFAAAVVTRAGPGYDRAWLPRSLARHAPPPRRSA
jgi:hypothetical protein